MQPSLRPRRVAVLGDALLDVVVQLAEPIRPDTDANGRTWVGPGGQAANVAAWVTALGGRAWLLATVGLDPAGALVAGGLRRRRVTLVGSRPHRGTGVVVSVTTRDGRRTMLTDRGVTARVRLAELAAAAPRGMGWVHLSGYTLLAPVGRTAAARVAALGAKVSVDCASVAGIDAVGARRFRHRIRSLRPAVVFASAAEAEALAPLEVAGASVVVTDGAGGCVVDGRRQRARPARLVDATGAGDAFVAGWLVGGVDLALAAGARCVAQLGAMPPDPPTDRAGPGGGG